mmetsp:Transcript_15468/g.29405  ORF Transcript_15468/g.29405 Transcript_15468/m.29405 type:complete len:86 (-) Transcript_15468:8-265(-)
MFQLLAIRIALFFGTSQAYYTVPLFFSDSLFSFMLVVLMQLLFWPASPHLLRQGSQSTLPIQDATCCTSGSFTVPTKKSQMMFDT